MRGSTAGRRAGAGGCGVEGVDAEGLRTRRHLWVNELPKHRAFAGGGQCDVRSALNTAKMRVIPTDSD